MDGKELKRTFNDIPGLYDEVRPTYPKELIEDILFMSDIQRSGSIIEVGCGTGQATEPFLEKGFTVHAVEEGKDLADFALKKLEHYGCFSITVSSFEKWDAPKEAFDLLIAGQVFHWIEPAYGLSKSASLLKPGGAIALFWNRDISQSTAFYQATDPVYAQYSVSVPKAQQPNSASVLYEGALRNSPHFFDFVLRRYPWQETYDKTRYFKLLDTFSPHRALGPEIRQKFYADLAEIVDSFGGSVTRYYEAVLLFAKNGHLEKH